MSSAAVFSLFNQYDSIRASIPADDISDLTDLDAQFRKLAVLSCASHLESDLIAALKEYFSKLRPSVGEFVRRTALERKFHTLFNWEQPLPDYFFKSWGADCERRYKARLSDPGFDSVMRSFMLLVASRNQLVHANLAEQSSDLTFAEVREHFGRAEQFSLLAVNVIEGAGEVPGPGGESGSSG